MRHISLLSIFTLMLLIAPTQTFAICFDDDSGQTQQQPQPPPPPPPPPTTKPPSSPPGDISDQLGGPPEPTAASQGPYAAGTTGTTTGTASSGRGGDVDVDSPTDADTDASGVDETAGMTGDGEYGNFDDSLPATGDGSFVRETLTACGEIRAINSEYYIISVKSRFRTRHYVVTPATIFSHSDFSQPDISLSMIEVGNRIMISYVTLHGMRIATRITVHE